MEDLNPVTDLERSCVCGADVTATGIKFHDNKRNVVVTDCFFT